MGEISVILHFPKNTPDYVIVHILVFTKKRNMIGSWHVQPSGSGRQSLKGLREQRHSTMALCRTSLGLLLILIIPDTWPDEVDSDTQSLKDMAFSILDDSDINEGNSDDSDSDADIICTGEKRKTGKEVNEAPDDQEVQISSPLWTRSPDERWHTAQLVTVDL